jgi:hypothetical protein
MGSLEEVPESVKDLLRMSRGAMEMFESTQKQIVKRLLREPALQQRVERLKSIRGVGAITALTWALEVADPQRFSSIGDAVSYCGLTAAFRSSAGKQQRSPISKQRNAWLRSKQVTKEVSPLFVCVDWRLPVITLSVPLSTQQTSGQVASLRRSKTSLSASAMELPRSPDRRRLKPKLPVT